MKKGVKSLFLVDVWMSPIVCLTNLLEWLSLFVFCLLDLFVYLLVGLLVCFLFVCLCVC